MKYSRFLSVVFSGFVLLLSGCSEPPYKNISNDELGQLKAQGIKVIDIRRPEEWKQTGVVEGSQQLTAFDRSGRFTPEFMPVFTAENNPEDPVILICRTGNRTSALANYLATERGYKNLYNVEDGITAWIRDGRQVEKCASC